MHSGSNGTFGVIYRSVITKRNRLHRDFLKVAYRSTQMSERSYILGLRGSPRHQVHSHILGSGLESI